MAIHLTAIVTGTTESTAALKTLLSGMVEKSVQEAACLQYELYQSSEDPRVFIFHELWADEAGLEQHNAQPYIQDFIARSGALLAQPAQLYKTNLIA